LFQPRIILQFKKWQKNSMKKIKKTKKIWIKLYEKWKAVRKKWEKGVRYPVWDPGLPQYCTYVKQGKTLSCTVRDVSGFISVISYSDRVLPIFTYCTVGVQLVTWSSSRDEWWDRLYNQELSKIN
jgi:hypothetical protein